MDTILSFLDDLDFLNDVQISSIFKKLKKIQTNTPQNFETFSKQIFEFSSRQSVSQITGPQSINIWNQLNNMNIIDDYGVLLVDTQSDALTAAVNQLTGINAQQKDHVLQLLNRHPELSYHNYIKNFDKNNPSSNLPAAGVYLPDEANVKTFTDSLQKNWRTYELLLF